MYKKAESLEMLYNRVIKKKATLIKKVSLFLGLSMLMTSVSAVTLTDLKFRELNNGKTQIHMSFDGPAPDLKVYALEDPTQLALDLKRTDNDLSKKVYKVNHDNVKDALAVSAGNRVRLVVNMNQLAPYTSSSQGKNLYVTIGDKNKGAVSRNTAEQTPAAAPRKPAGASSVGTTQRINVRDVSFERTDNGAGNVNIKMGANGFKASHRRSGKTVYVTIPNSNLSSQVQRVIDLSKFGATVKSIHSQNRKGDSTIKITGSGNFDYDAYQVDENYVVSFKPKTSGVRSAAKTTKEPDFQSTRSLNDASTDGYSGEKLSLNFQNIEVRSVLQLIADFTNLNLVAADSVKGNITLRLKNVPWDQALDIVLKAKGLDKRREGNVLLVAPAAEIAERELKELKASQELQALAPLQTAHIKVKYADAEDIFRLFLSPSASTGSRGAAATPGTPGGAPAKPSPGSVLSPRGSVIVDARTNSLFVTETAERLAMLEQLIKRVDVPIRQVMVEARIVVASADAARNLGVRWGAFSTNGSNVVSGGTQAFVDAVNGNDINILDTMMVDLGVEGINNFSPSSLLIGSVKNNRILNLQLSALESSGNGEIISQPKVITGDKQQALIKSGSQVPYQTEEDGTVTTEFKDVVLQLDVTPHITPDNRIIMDLRINQDSIDPQSDPNAEPIINITELNTQVLAGNGETIVLGGVFRTEDIDSITKTPLLGDIPIVGYLFRAKTKRLVKAETLIFITPKIIDEALID